MTSREKILADVRRNQPALTPAPDMAVWENIPVQPGSLLQTFSMVAGNVGSSVILVDSIADLKSHLSVQPEARVLTTIPGLLDIATDAALYNSAPPHELENVELAILQGEFGVAENSAIWVTEQQMGTRVLPFICQHLALMINAEDIVPDMHAAYQRTHGHDHNFAAFIAGPSKTADIEQSLVLGAHGPRSMVIFVLA